MGIRNGMFITPFILQKRNEPLLENKNRMYHYHKVEREVKGGYSEKCSMQKENPLKEHWSYFFHIESPIRLSLLKPIHCAALLLREAPVKRAEGGEGGRVKRHCVKIESERQFVCPLSANSARSDIKHFSPLNIIYAI